MYVSREGGVGMYVQLRTAENVANLVDFGVVSVIT